jgi:hypothetical protein
MATGKCSNRTSSRPQCAEGEAMKRRRRKVITTRGKVLSFIRANNDWMAIVVEFDAEPDQPVLSQIVPIAELKGSARRKADRWMRWLA